MSSLLLTRRTALRGIFSSVLLPTVAAPVIAERAVALDPWQQAEFHAFALHDALAAMPEQWWWTQLGPGKGGRGGAIHFWESGSHQFHRAERPTF